MQLNINNRFTKELPADLVTKNYRRQVTQACFSYVTPKKTREPKLIHTSIAMADTLGVSENDLHSSEFTHLMTGNIVMPDTKPYAMCYGGHQFGQWAGQLGDGRAINLFEVTHNTKT